jgi:hypothetical protein
MRKKRADGAGEMARSDRLRGKAKHRLSRRFGKGALIIAGIGFVLIVIFLIIPSRRQKQAEPIPRETFTTGSPINKIDPTSGKPIVPGITSSYNGYTIGHCCAQSKSQWEALSVSQKDAKIRSFLQ